MASRHGVSGWALTVASLVAGLGAVAVAFALRGTGEEGLRASIRATARLSAVLFSITFATSSLHALFRSGWGRWLLARRRHLGLGFAAVHFTHLGVIIALATLHSASFWAKVAITTVIGGGLGYVWIAAMAATSFDAAPRRIGPRTWRALHTSGMWVLWAIFVFSYAGRARTQPFYAAFLGLLLLASVLRIVARLVRRSRSGDALAESAGQRR